MIICVPYIHRYFSDLLSNIFISAKLKSTRVIYIFLINLSMIGNFLKGKTAVVTGSLSGIGLGIAKRLSAHGANIVLNGFADDALIKGL